MTSIYSCKNKSLKALSCEVESGQKTKTNEGLGVVVHTFKASTLEGETGWSL